MFPIRLCIYSEQLTGLWKLNVKYFDEYFVQVVGIRDVNKA